MAQAATIRLVVPGQLQYRNVAVRVVFETCRLVSGGAIGPAGGSAAADTAQTIDLTNRFDAEFVSAFSEIFNNIAIHAYQRRGGGDIEITLTPSVSGLAVEIRDHGVSFDIETVPPPELESLPEGGMGIHIARALVDDVQYVPGRSGGSPNIWRLTKYVSAAQGSAASG
jgi:anti-sigma regulatory factor (Ser/Thr protein kinase)